jgi:hypothetical protein
VDSPFLFSVGRSNLAAISFPFFRKSQTGRRSAFPFFGKVKSDGDQPSLFSEKSNRTAISLPFFRKSQIPRRSAFPFFGKDKLGGDQPSLFSEKSNRTAISLLFFREIQFAQHNKQKQKLYTGKNYIFTKSPQTEDKAFLSSVS